MREEPELKENKNFNQFCENGTSMKNTVMYYNHVLQSCTVTSSKPGKNLSLLKYLPKQVAALLAFL